MAEPRRAQDRGDRRARCSTRLGGGATGAAPRAAAAHARRRAPSQGRHPARHERRVRGLRSRGEGGAQGVRAERADAGRDARERWSRRCARRCSRTTSQLSRYAVEETGLGRYEDKLKKNKLVADKTPGPEILRADRVHRRRRPDAHRARAVRRDRSRSRRRPTRPRPSSATPSAWSRRQRGRLQRPSVGGAGLQLVRAHAQRGHRSRRAARATCSSAIERADHRERAGADEAPARAHRRGHRRPGVVKAGDELGQAARSPPARAIRRRSSTRPRTSTRPPTHRARRVARQQHRLHRREGSHRGRLDRRRS